MLEQGLVTLVQSDPVVASIATNGGGYHVQVPKDLLTPDGPPTWSYMFVGGSADITLQAERGPRIRRLQIDTYGNSSGNGADAITLSKAIDDVLNGFSGTLADPDNTGVLSCLAGEEPSDFFDEAGRTYRRMTEYDICF
jgi:hypothetical protein